MGLQSQHWHNHKTVNFIQIYSHDNTHRLPVRASHWVSFVRSNCDLVVLYAISCYIGPCYNETQLFLSGTYCCRVHITMTSSWVRWHPKSPASRLFTQPFIQVQIKKNMLGIAPDQPGLSGAIPNMWYVCLVQCPTCYMSVWYNT